ncbi:MAG TPA: Spy/CpxP family protein refolding chaperone [Pseudolabrys sp.]|nr:Spy/CpxP family protein refolding chaperone [Pseudolabrys sp.]
MRALAVIVTGLLLAAVPLDRPAQAQLSPQGILGGMTRPFRQMLGNLGHVPRSHRHRPSNAARAASPPPDRGAPGVVKTRLGRAGPAAWPTAYEEAVGFAFWPDDYGPQLRSHGFDVIADTIAGRFDRVRAPTRVATTGTARDDSGTGVSAEQCDDVASGNDRWPVTRLEQMLQLSDAQHAALEKLQTAMNDAARTIKADCHQLEDLSPPDRLRALVQTLWVVRDGAIALRQPLKGFYDPLTSAQQSNFAVEQPQDNPAPDSRMRGGANRQYQACASQNVGSAERLIKEIEMKIRPDKAQAASLENLHKVSSDMAKLLIASCVQPVPADPLARLDSAGDQFTAINYAAANVQIALDDFYGRLSQTQRARLEATGR